MIQLNQPKSNLRHMATISVFIVLIFYLIYHAINGERGIIAYVKLSKQLNTLETQLEHVRADRLHLEHRVNLMRSDSIDLDLLDEQARKILGYSKDNEVIYLHDKADK